MCPSRRSTSGRRPSGSPAVGPAGGRGRAASEWSSLHGRSKRSHGWLRKRCGVVLRTWGDIAALAAALAGDMRAS